MMQKSSCPETRRICSPDGVLEFAICKSVSGVHLERSQRISDASRAGLVSVQVVIASGADLQRLIDADEMRFVYPLVFVELSRAFDDLHANT